MFYQFSHPATVDYFLVEEGENFSFPVHIHECFEVIWIESGEMRVTVEGRTDLLTQGQAILIFPNQHHSLESSICRHRLCIFSPKLVASFATKRAETVPLCGLFAPPPDLMAALARAQSKLERKGLLYLLCDLFDRDREYRPRDQGSAELTGKIFRFIERHYKEDCSLEAMAAELGYDRAYLSRHFKKTVGLGFKCYVTMFRLNHACYLLENTETGILECAAESGFDSVRSFNRNFKEQFHMTPRQYLEQKRS